MPIVAPKKRPDTKAGRVLTGKPSRRHFRQEASWQAAKAFACILRAILIRGIPLCDRFHSRISRRLQTCERGLEARNQPDEGDPNDGEEAVLSFAPFP